MLTVSQEFTNAFNSNTRNWSLKVEIQRNDIGASWIDISDRVLQCNITHDFNSRNGSVTIQVDNYDYSYSPYNRESSVNFVGGVYNPILDARHKIRVSEGLETVNGIEYVVKFTGLLGDEIDVDSYTPIITLTCRDFSKYLQDTYIFLSKTYYISVVENVIQDLLNQFVPDLGLQVYVSEPTKYMIGRPDQPYTAKDTNLWDAVQSLADAASFELRFMEDGTLILRRVIRKFNDPKAIAVATFDESMMVKDKMGLSDANVRNHIVLKVSGMNPIEKKNQASINKYGRRYMEVDQSMAVIITNMEQGAAMVDDMLQDMSYVHPQETVEMPLYPQLQIADFVLIQNSKTGADPTYDKFKIMNLQDSFQPNQKRTMLTLVGATTYIPEDSIPPMPITNLKTGLISRTIQNYPNSGWNGQTKTQSYPTLNWTTPTGNISGTAIPVDFGGYTIYRKNDLHTNLTMSGNINWTQTSGTAGAWYAPYLSGNEYTMQADFVLSGNSNSLTWAMNNPPHPTAKYQIVVSPQYSGGAYHPHIAVYYSGNSIVKSVTVPVPMNTGFSIRMDIVSGNWNIYTGNSYGLFYSNAIPSGGLYFNSISGFTRQNYAYVQNLSYKVNNWYQVSCLPSYVSALNLQVQQFYDYTAAPASYYEYYMTSVDKMGAFVGPSGCAIQVIGGKVYANPDNGGMFHPMFVRADQLLSGAALYSPTVASITVPPITYT